MGAGVSLRLMLSLCVAVGGGAACQRRVSSMPTEPPVLRCLAPAAFPVTWYRAPVDRDLQQWCAQVGPPLVVPAVSDPAVRPGRLLVLSWNVHVGAARVIELVESLRRLAGSESGVTGMVLLLQETYRAGDAAGAPVPGGGVPKSIRPDRPALDVAALGRYLGMSVAYVPSMRNGEAVSSEEHEDRGNAILSSEPLSDVRAIEMPFGKQRRVAVMATISPRGWPSRMRMVSAHFDTFWFGGHQRRQAEFLAERLREVMSDSESLPLIVGADTNAVKGEGSGTVKALASVVALVNCGPRAASLFPRLDFFFSTLAAVRNAPCRTLPVSYGSDHRPLLLTLDDLAFSLHSQQQEDEP